MKKLRTIDIYTIPLLFLIPAAVTLRCFALLTSFNSETMHFDNKSAFMIGNIIVIVSILGFLTYLLIGEKERELIAKNNNAASYIPAGIVSTALLFMGAENIGMAFGGYPAGVLSILAFLCGVLAFLSVVSFFLAIFIEREENLYKAAFSLCIVFFLAIYATLIYFNKQVHPTNSPNRIIDEMAYLSASLFFLFEARIPLGRTKWRGYIAFGLIATLLCSYSAIPSLIFYFVNGYTVSESLFENILTLALSIFICSKVLQYKRLTPDAECDTAKQIAFIASKRAKELEDHRNLPHAHENDNKEENDDTEDTSNYTFDLSTPDENSEKNISE